MRAPQLAIPPGVVLLFQARQHFGRMKHSKPQMIVSTAALSINSAAMPVILTQSRSELSKSRKACA
jgi:hypothetical protein